MIRTSSAGGIIGIGSWLQTPAMFSGESIGLASSGPDAAGRKEAGQQVRDTDADKDMSPRSNMFTHVKSREDEEVC